MGRKWLYIVGALYFVITGCVTQFQQPSEETAEVPPREKEETPPAGTTTAPSSPDKDDEPTVVTDLSPDELHAYIEAHTNADYRVVTLDDRPLIQISSPPTFDETILLAVVSNDRQIALFRAPLDRAGRSHGVTTVEPLALNVSVLSAAPLRVDDRQTGYNGFHLNLFASDREEDLFVVATASGSYSVRTPFSTVSQAVLRDLNNDGLRELVQYSRVFEAGGKREMIVDVFEWEGNGFIHSGSLPLLRRVNGRLRSLKQHLEGAQAGDTQFDAALKHDDDGPNPSELFPVSSARIPEFMEIPVEMGRSQWEVEHDIAVIDTDETPVIYRIHIVISANPFMKNPVAIRDLDGKRD